MITAELEQEVLQRLGDAVPRKWNDKWQGQWLLHHDNTPSHTLFVVQQFLTKKNIPVFTQPPHLLILLAADTCLMSRYVSGSTTRTFR
jgi:hypothetical protein